MNRVSRDIKVFKEKIVEESADYTAAAAVNKMSPGLTLGEPADSFPVIEAADDIDKVSGWLQGAVTSAFEAPAAAIGLLPGEAEISAGIGSNLVLAPITGPLERAATYLELAGLVAGLAIGSHPLVLACLKPLAHTQLEHAISRCFSEVVSGLLDTPQAGAHPLLPSASGRLQILTPSEGSLSATHAAASRQFVPAERPSVSSEAHSTLREVTRDEPLWLCLAFAPKLTRSAPVIGTATIVRERDVTKPVVLPIGDDNFLRTLPEALRGGSVAEVDLPSATKMRELPAGRHFILSMEGVGIAGLSTEINSRIGYQHPDCDTGDCAPPGGHCVCRCSGCWSSNVRL